MADWKALHAALAAYKPQALWAGSYFDDGRCCALGAVVGPWLASGEVECRLALRRAFGLSDVDHADVVAVNDQDYETPQVRYTHMLDYLAKRAGL